MIIDKIETKRNKTTIFCGEKNFVFHPKIVEKYDLRQGEYDGNRFFEAKKESDDLLCAKALYDLVERSEKSKKGYEEALLNKGFPFPLVRRLTDEAEKKGFIDDRRFAECYIHTHEKAKGWFRIKAELVAKGVPEEIADEFSEAFGSREEECLKLTNKLARGLEATYENRCKLYAKLARKGFSSDEINSALSKCGVFLPNE